MPQKQVQVSADNSNVQITVGPPYGLVRVVNIDLTDSKSIVEGIIEVLSLSDSRTSERINALTQKIESLEKRVLSEEDVLRLVNLLRAHPSEFRSDGRPTNDDLLANKLEAMLKN